MAANTNQESKSLDNPIILKRGSVSHASIIVLGNQKCIALVVNNVKRVFFHSAALLARLAEIDVLVVDFSAFEPETYQAPGVLAKIFAAREKLGIGSAEGGRGTTTTNPQI
jgi:hypothetical protein